MSKRINAMELADLDVRLMFPDGDNTAPAAIVATCRRSNLVIFKQELTGNDLVNLMAGRTVGSFEGAAEMLSEQGRAQLNKERRLVSVRLPLSVRLFEDDDDRNLDRWAMDAVRVFGAADYRVTVGRSNLTVSLMFYVNPGDRSGSNWVDAVQEQMNELGRDYAERANTRATQS